MKNRVVDILIERDNLTPVEAKNRFDEVRSELMDAIDGTNCLDPEEVLEYELGLEPDYLDDFLFGGLL